MREPTTIAARRGILICFGLVSAATLLLSACAPGPNPAAGAGQDPAGFLLGLWHGVILPVTFLISLFTDDVSVYAVVNRGNWYDVGFFLGVMISLGGGGAGARSKRRMDETGAGSYPRAPS